MEPKCEPPKRHIPRGKLTEQYVTTLCHSIIHSPTVTVILLPHKCCRLRNITVTPALISYKEKFFSNLRFDRVNPGARRVLRSTYIYALNFWRYWVNRIKKRDRRAGVHYEREHCRKNTKISYIKIFTFRLVKFFLSLAGKLKFLSCWNC